ncbi:unnamed protein product [Peniophora sp. CBMAI 1063]|nr:unnamed protein product [Peniophora sp. CBMAI 1063]
MSSAPRTYARRHRRQSTAPARSPSPVPAISPVKSNAPPSPTKSPRRIVEVVVPRSPYHNRVRSPLKRAADSSDTTTSPVGSAKRRKIAPARNADSDSDIEEVFPTVLSTVRTNATPSTGRTRKSMASATPSSLRKSSAVYFDATGDDEDALPEPPSTRRSPRKSATIEPERRSRSPPPKQPLKRVRHPIRLPPEASDQTDTRATSSSDDPLLLDSSPVKPTSKRTPKPASKPPPKRPRSTSPVKPASTATRKPLSRTASRLKASQSLPTTTSPSNASQIRRTNTLPTSQSHPTSVKGKGKDKGPLTKDLSDLFDFTSPEKDGRGAGLGERAAEPVARRMLARARTEADLSAEDSQDSGAPSRILSRVNSFQPAENDVKMQEDDALIFPLELSADPSAEPDILPMRPPPAPLQGSASGSGLNSGSIKTYAGRSRSFLAPMPGAGLMDFDLVPEPASYRELRKELGVDDFEPLSSPPTSPRRPTSPRKSNSVKGKARDDGLATLGAGKPKLAPNMHNDVRGLSELRNRGEARRFLDAVQDLFDGLSPESAPAIRRASALECLTKMCDSGFARRARASEFRSRVWEALRARKDEGGGERDRILDACAAAFVGIVVREGAAELGELGRDEAFEVQCWELMGEVGRGRDILELEAAGKGVTGRVERMNLATLSKIRAKITSQTQSHPPLRAHLSLALSSLHPSALSPAHIPSLLDSLLPDLALLPSRLAGYSAGLPLLPDSSVPDGPSLEHIRHCLTMLDAFLLNRWGSEKDDSGRAEALVEGRSAECTELAEGLLALAASCRILLSEASNEADEAIKEVARGCLESALRVLVNLSHENAAWCALLLDQSLALPLVLGLVAGFRTNLSSGPMKDPHLVVENVKGQAADGAEAGDDDEESAAQASEFDRLCLALGLFTNLVQTDAGGRAKDGVRLLNVNPTCPLTRSCAQSCACTQRMPSLDVLAQLYLSTSPANDIDDSDGSDVTRAVLRGHLAVLLGLLMRGSEENAAALRHLKDDLLGSAREFAGLYRVVMERVARAGEDDVDEDGAGGIGGMGGDGSKGAEVATDVVRFLESL